MFQLCIKWLEAIGINLSEKNLEDLRVCDAHFSDDCKVPYFPTLRTNLKQNAYPTLHLGLQSNGSKALTLAEAAEDLSVQCENMSKSVEAIIINEQNKTVSKGNYYLPGIRKLPGSGTVVIFCHLRILFFILIFLNAISMRLFLKQ